MTADGSAAREDAGDAGGGAGPAARRCPGADHGRPAGLAPVGGAAAARAGRDQPLRAPARPAQDAAGADAAWLLDRAATYLQVHARLAEARPLAERALAIAEAAYGPDHPDVATGLNNLATILAGPGPAGRGPAAGRTGPGHHRGRLRPRPPRRRHRPEQPRHHPAGPGAAGRGPAAGRTGPGHRRGRLRPRPPRRRHPPEQPRHHPAGPGPAGRGPAAGRTGPGHHRGRLRPRPPRRRHPPEQPRPILQDLGQPDEARPLAERALAITEAAYGPDHPDVAIRPEQPRP